MPGEGGLIGYFYSSILFLLEYGDTNTTLHSSVHDMHVVLKFSQLIYTRHGRDLDPLSQEDTAGFYKAISLGRWI